MNSVFSNRIFDLGSDDQHDIRHLQASGFEPTALFEQYEPLSSERREAPGLADDASENLYPMPA